MNNAVMFKRQIRSKKNGEITNKCLRDLGRQSVIAGHVI